MKKDFPGYRSEAVRRNIKTRMAAMEATATELAGQLGITKKAIYKRLQRLAPVDIQWFAVALVCRMPSLLKEPADALVEPLPPPDYFHRVQSLLGTEPTYKETAARAFGLWQPMIEEEAAEDDG